MNRIKEPRSSIWVGVGRDRTGGADQPAWALPRFPCAVLTARRTWLLPWEARSLEVNESGKGLILAYRESTNLHSISPGKHNGWVPANHIDQFREQLKKGPIFARVDIYRLMFMGLLLCWLGPLQSF
ncbi:uncharacterized protein LOC124699833 isoform X2 [Lolium rigidum]|uniref:uncharacterized protein LOC124699833 isoform X2 n=1 Tax=Lolium rigidum TaxID=89674 RepID=UPI001F5C2961|nr:uncharacterized protein LOC124699833 isoform X2 [Lolium rigidum]